MSTGGAYWRRPKELLYPSGIPRRRPAARTRHDGTRYCRGCISTHGSERACILLYPTAIASGLGELVVAATSAARNLLFERSLALSDRELTLFVNTLRSCGILSDYSGNLLPDLVTRLHQAAFLGNGNPRQFQCLLAVIDLRAVQTCIHGRCLLPDALQSLAELVRTNHTSSPSAIRQLLQRHSSREAYARLIATCSSFRTLVKEVEKTSIKPPPGDEIWTYQFYDPIATFEAFGNGGLAACS
jgi:hypothetical protein